MTNQFAELEMIDDEELLAASGGRVRLLTTGVRAIRSLFRPRTPSKAIDLASSLVPSGESDVQNLQVE